MIRSTVFLALAIIAGLIGYHAANVWLWLAAAIFFVVWIWLLASYFEQPKYPPTMARKQIKQSDVITGEGG